MGMKQAFIGGNHVKEEKTEDLLETLRSNRAILVVPTNEDADDSPELTRCQNIGEVFKAYKPSAEIEVKDDEGGTENHKVGFQKVADFNADKVVEAVPSLRRQRDKLAILGDLRYQLKQNVALKKAMDNEKQRQELIASLKQALRLLGG